MTIECAVCAAVRQPPPQPCHQCDDVGSPVIKLTCIQTGAYSSVALS